MHESQITYCKLIKSRFPDYFKGKRVLDVGSLDINGNNRYLFEDCAYTGIDIYKGNNVDVVSLAHEYKNEPFDVIISTEMLEHDRYWVLSLNNMYSLLKPNGLMLLTCAAPGRDEHGTLRTSPQDSPFTSGIDYWRNYYNPLVEDDLKLVLGEFRDSETTTTKEDLYFYGIR